MSFDEDKGLMPGWYLARDMGSIWWNIFVYITHKPPFRCIRLTDKESYETLISPEEIKQISPKRISFDEFKVIRSLQHIRP